MSEKKRQYHAPQPGKTQGFEVDRELLKIAGKFWKVVQELGKEAVRQIIREVAQQCEAADVKVTDWEKARQEVFVKDGVWAYAVALFRVKCGRRL